MVATNIPKTERKKEYVNEYIIDRIELLRLKEQKLIDKKFYVYLALKLSNVTAKTSIDIEFFCEQWQITESELMTALGQLQKKGALQPVARQLQLELY